MINHPLRGAAVAILAAATLATAACNDVAADEVKTALASFQDVMSPPDDGLDADVRSRAALAREFIGALALADTMRLSELAISRTEYAHFIYPDSPLMRAPYRQPVDIAWILHATAHDKGFTRLLRRLGGRPLEYRGIECGAATLLQGANRFWTNCRIAFVVDGGDTVTTRLFTAIVERDGRYNILSYDNDF